MLPLRAEEARVVFDISTFFSVKIKEYEANFLNVGHKKLNIAMRVMGCLLSTT